MVRRGGDDDRGGVPRAARVAERIRTQISEMLVNGAIKDPRASGAMVSSVSVSDDLSRATVRVRLLDPSATKARQEEVVRVLQKAAGFVRSEIAKTLVARRTPELFFAWDEGVDHAQRLESLLEEIRREGEGE
jgi:ribosome-binding factor A